MLHRLIATLAAVTFFFVAVETRSADDFPTPVNTEKSPTPPMSPEEVLQTVKLPPGFKLSLVAAEPLIQNPIAMTMDERGRLWVAENYSWSGNAEGGFNPEQRDRIVILEDTDADGIPDQRTVFWDDARMLTSLEVGYGGVWAICLPHLVFIPDANRDDVPDRDPVIVLDGFDSGIQNHTPANGLKWGPDGWLYGRQGILSPASIGKPGASDSQRFQMDTGIWRYHPVRDTAEPVMHGMTNSWGFDFDQYGEIFVINTVIGHLWHVIPGAHTERMFGLDINPFSYKLLPQVADHVHWDTGEKWMDVQKGVTSKTDAAGGGHAHIGLMIYQGDNWPEEYQHRVYTLNLHGRRINSDHLQRQGAGYTATHGPDMCFISDEWFRGMELLTGPDGGVYICDWSDTGECHDHDGVHRTSGRIYKLTYETPVPLASFDLSQRSTNDLISYHAHPNTWWARQSRRVLTERVNGILDANELKELHSELHAAFAAESSPIPRLRLMETIATVGGTSEDWLNQCLQSDNEYERLRALKIFIDQETWPARPPADHFLNRLATIASSDESGLVQLHLASALQRLPRDQRWPIAEALANREQFAEDRMLPLMIWYGIEPSLLLNPEQALQLLKNSRMPVLSELIARRIAVEIESQPMLFEQLVTVIASKNCRFPESAISGIHQALNGWRKAKAPPQWQEVAELYSEAELIREQIQNLNIIFGDGRTIDELKANITNADLPHETRRAALRSLLSDPSDDLLPVLIRLLDDRVMINEAIRGLSFFSAAEIPQRILERSGHYDQAQRALMVETLSSRPTFAKELLQAIQSGRVTPSELSAFHARQIVSFGDEALSNQLKELWGDIRASAADKRQLMENYKLQLTPDVIAAGNRSQGRKLFESTCATCHVMYGAGRLVGPDLTGSNRTNLDYLLENIIDPSASVGASFQTVVVVMEDGRVLNGVISESNERTLTLQAPQGAHTLDRNEIEDLITTDASLMPEGLLQNLTAEQIRDLFSYMMGSDQVPLPQD